MQIPRALEELDDRMGSVGMAVLEVGFLCSRGVSQVPRFPAVKPACLVHFRGKKSSSLFAFVVWIRETRFRLAEKLTDTLCRDGLPGRIG
jgi:hypothetical protein